MTADRLLEIYALMESRGRENSKGSALCAVAEEFLELDGAAIVLKSGDAELLSLCTSNHTASALMDLELTLGEGPAVDASRGDAAGDTNLLDATSSNWEAYRPEALALGARAVFGFPIRLGAIRFGALSLFRSSPGPLNAEQDSDAYLMASVIGRAILAAQAGTSDEDLMGKSSGSSLVDIRVHQAAGMLSVQASLSVKDALVLLRAHAFGIGCQLSELANLVVSRATRYDRDSQTWIDGAMEDTDEQ
jgi:hypothetical protein